MTPPEPRAAEAPRSRPIEWCNSVRLSAETEGKIATFLERPIEGD